MKPNAPYNKDVYKDTLKNERIRTSFIGYIAIVSTVVGMMLVLSLFRQGNIIDEIRHTQQTGSPTQKQLKDITVTIKNCVEPTGECYKDGEARTKLVVADIGNIIAATISCGDKLGTQDYVEITECTIQTLKEKSNE